MHKIAISRPVEMVDDGLMLGNGDISCSFYQQCGRLIWRFGKGDVWDRRVDYHLDPPPAHIREMERGLKEEGWCCGPYGGEVKALNGTKHPERMKEICQGASPSYVNRGYPCPKPVGELIMHFPLGMNDFSIRQILEIERSELRVCCCWAGGVRLELCTWISPERNAFFLKYAFRGYTADAAMGKEHVVPIYFTLCRHADKSPLAFGVEYRLTTGPAFRPYISLGGQAMPPPQLRKFSSLRGEGEEYYIEQLLPPEATFPEGLRCGLACRMRGSHSLPFPPEYDSLAAVDCLPEDPGIRSGILCVGVETDPDPEVLREKLERTLSLDAAAERKASRRSARKFWARSGIFLPDDPLLEECWYANLHARRISFRKGFLPPGLAFPSTVEDYSLWHGDYHMNYNFQQPFYGDYAANQLEIGDSYFDAMKPILQMGKLIAQRYYDSRGTFVQLSNYPVNARDDVIGCAPMGRMAYMTGWAGHQYFWRYQYTKDRDFLRSEGYPVLKELAQFYLDFLSLEKDGRYHAFPSNQGEDGFTGNPEAYRDLPQIMTHIRFALTVAEYAARELNVDSDFQELCRERIEHLAEMKKHACIPRPGPEYGREISAKYDAMSRETRPWEEVLSSRGDFSPPEFLGFDGEIRTFGDSRENPPYADADFYTRRWYAGKLPSVWLIELRNHRFHPRRDWKYIRRMLEKWRMPNGLLRSMALPMYGKMGAYTESTGILAPIQECLLEGHSDVLKVFPYASPLWRKNAGFHQLRAAGGFLVSARREHGRVTMVKIKADAPGTNEVKLWNPFGRGKWISSRRDVVKRDRILSVKLKKGETWVLKSAGKDS